MSTQIGAVNPLQIQSTSRFYVGDPVKPPEVVYEGGLEASSFFAPASPLELPTQRRLILPGQMPPTSRFSFPEEEPQPQAIQIPIDSIIDVLEALGEEKTIMSFGFRPMPIHDEFEVKWGEKALSIAHKLKDDLSSQTIEEAIKFLGSSKLIEVLRTVLKLEDRIAFGLNQAPISTESKSIVARASSLSEKLLNELSESTLQETVQFLESTSVSKIMKKLAGRNFGNEELDLPVESSELF